jgi:diguanylate cyclase (GGDEF)-like protein/PAS domain S-box-containing protein
LLSVNRFGAERLGYPADDLVQADFDLVYVEEDRKHVKAAISECLANTGELRVWEARMLHKDGSVSWSRSTGRSILTRDGLTNVLVVCEDITEAWKLSEQLSYEARHDALTGLYNRRELEFRLQRALESVQENHQLQHTFCYIDLDQFKVINDNCGHVGGDEMLRQLGGVLGSCIRGADTVARLGGDEFGVLLDNCPADHADKVAQQIREAINGFRFAWDGKSFTLSGSIGIVTIDHTFKDFSQIMLAADSSCYAAKDAGRNRVHTFEPNDSELLHRHGEMRWVIKIKRALEADNFALYAQPIVPLADDVDEGLHCEVLLRLIDDDGSVVPPGAFLPAAERYNISGNVDRWVVRSTLAWLDEHQHCLEQLSTCAINLSGQSLADELFMNEILAMLPESSVPAHKLCFEITETAAITNLQVATAFIEKLREQGCRFALDDFGSGLSSFAYLNNLPVDYVKIDGVFIKDIAQNRVNEAIVQSISDVARVMGKKTIAEFVENDAIIEKLREIGVDCAQGYGIGKPVPIGEIHAATGSLRRAAR